MKYGLIFALMDEFKLIGYDIKNPKLTTIANREFIEGTLYGKDVVAVMSRVGKVASASTATTLIDRFNVDCVIFCGTAGGIDHDLHVGDIVVGDLCIQHDVVVMGKLFTVPEIDVDYFESDKALTASLFKAASEYVKFEMLNDIPKEHLDEFNISAPKAVIGTVATGDQFISDGSKTQWIIDNVKNAKCVEMEGAAVSQVCYEYKIPFGIMRVVSDDAGSNSYVDYDAFVEEASSHFTKGIVKSFLTKE